MTLPELAYIQWAKALPPAEINLARSGVDPCPPAKLGLRAKDLVVSLPVQYGYLPLREAIARRYGVGVDRVFSLSGGTSFANWLACATLVGDGGGEVIVEAPTYEPLLTIPQGLGCEVIRLPRAAGERYAIDLERFASLVTPRTRLAIVSNLHNPSGVRIPMATLAEMARLLDRVGAHLLVDEVYLECLFDERTESCVYAGPNVIATSSLTKAYGLDGLRCGWILGPADVVRKAMLAHDILAGNAVAMGERMSLAAFERLSEIGRRPRAVLARNLGHVRGFLERERRLSAAVPDGGTVAFVGLPGGLDGDTLADHLRERYSTLVVPGRFFESPRHVRLSFGVRTPLLLRGLANVSRALDDLTGRGASTPVAAPPRG